MARTVKEAKTGAVYGLAFGDSWGYTTEFLHHSQIDPRTRPPELSRVSDDTQMSLYNMEVLNFLKEETGFSEEWQGLLVNSEAEQARVRILFADAHLRFADDPDNNRAPGNTCMSALWRYKKLKQLEAVYTGFEGIGVDNNSKGCGTIMRAPWIGLFSELSRDAVAVLSIIQSQTTHGHPISWVAAAVSSLLMKDIIEDNIIAVGGDKPKAEFVYSSLGIIEELMKLDSVIADSEYVNAAAELWYSFNKVFLENWDAFLLSSESDDATEFFGQGWVADDALFVSVAVASLYRGRPSLGTKRLVWTSGDSDSIAAIGAALMFADVKADPEELLEMSTYMKNSLEVRYASELYELDNLI